MQIEINSSFLPTLARLTEKRGIPQEQYLSEYISDFLLRQYKNELIAKIENKKLDDIATIETAITTIDESIKVRDYVESAPIIETPLETATSTEIGG